MQIKTRPSDQPSNDKSSNGEGIDWPKYAPHMDLMAKLMPSYEENLDSLKRHIEERGLSGKARVVDLGAGTGIYCEMIANLLPESEIFHVDFDPAMNAIAKAKYEKAGIDNVEIICEHIQRVDFDLASVDLIVCVNVLYAVQPQNAIALKMRKWLRSDGSLFIIDFGRKQSALDWGLHFLTNAIKGKNIRTYFQFLLYGQQITRQALKGRKAQERGEYWVHTTEEFGSFLETSGYAVEYVGPCYRGYADLAICRPS